MDKIKDRIKTTLKSFSRDEVCRNCENLCDIHTQRLGGLKLGNLGTKNAILSQLCDRIGTEDVGPLMALMDLFHVTGNEHQSIRTCKETLLTHQKRSERLSDCIECTSPPRTPVYPYSRPNFLFITPHLGGQRSPKSSPFSSPVSPLLPSTVLQHYGLGIEVQPIPESF